MICVMDDSDSIVQVEGFNNFMVSQDGTQRYNYMTDTVYNSEIASHVCQEGISSGEQQHRVCYFKFVLLARFFSDNNPPDLLISGDVFVGRDGDGSSRVCRYLCMD
jgi:hypothetical protein